MEPGRVGRILGVGTRVASSMLRERAAQASQSPKPDAKASALPYETAPLSQVYAERGRRVARGTRKFGQSIWGPFAHASSVLWLEITGLFFGLFAFFFASNAYKLRAFYMTGAEHQKFLIYAICTLVFLYFTVSSFLRAGRKEKRKRQRVG